MGCQVVSGDGGGDGGGVFEASLYLRSDNGDKGGDGATLDDSDDGNRNNSDDVMG